MRTVIQRVSSASVAVAGKPVRTIGPGLVVLVAVGADDTSSDSEWLAGKIVRLRIFSGPDGRRELSLQDIGGEALVISQFTLLGTLRKGTRPSYHRSAAPGVAAPLYERFVGDMGAALGKPVTTGEFGAEMQLTLTNEGPVTLILDSKRQNE